MVNAVHVVVLLLRPRGILTIISVRVSSTVGVRVRVCFCKGVQLLGQSIPFLDDVVILLSRHVSVIVAGGLQFLRQFISLFDDLVILFLGDPSAAADGQK